MTSADIQYDLSRIPTDPPLSKAEAAYDDLYALCAKAIEALEASESNADERIAELTAFRDVILHSDNVPMEINDILSRFDDMVTL